MKRTGYLFAGGLVPLTALFGIALTASHADSGGDPLTTPNSTGALRTFTPSGMLDTSNPFFQSLGTNGRACVTCHQLQDGWSVTPAHIQDRFKATNGLDPIFRTVDGSNSPLADVSTADARLKAYSMLLNKGLIRVGIGIPANAEFTLDNADDPYHYASANELSLFRRPLPSTNLRFLTGVMWDGRETLPPSFAPLASMHDNNSVLVSSLAQQASDATLGHAQAASAPTASQLQQIVDFETSLATAQIADNQAGALNAQDALGGPRILSTCQFFIGINDTLGADPTGAAFNPAGMSLFSAWTNGGDTPGNGAKSSARAAVARGEVLFNTKPILITGVGGLNDKLGLPTISGTCTTCHSTPNIGNHSVSLPVNIGLTDASRRTPDMPLYTLKNKVTGETIATTDPGRALITGKWSDIGKFKGPILRGLAARPPYFHNGSAATLDDAVAFYDSRFNIGFTAQEKSDLVAFLRSL